MKRKILSIVTVLAMLCTLVSPLGVFAGETENEIVPTGMVSDQYSPDAETGYLAFTSDSQFSLGIVDYADGSEWDGDLPWDGTMEYTTATPTADTVWTKWDGTAVTAGAKENNGDKHAIYFRGSDNTKLTMQLRDDSGDQYGTVWHIDMADSESDDGVACSGNLETLLDYQTVLAGGHPEMAVNCCDRMFYDCDRLMNIPEMPATELSRGCYAEMFYDCDGIRDVPDMCYQAIPDDAMYEMFSLCDGLTSVGNISAGQVGEDSFEYAFYGCTGIEEIGNISVEEADEYAFYDAFQQVGNAAQLGNIEVGEAHTGAFAYMFYESSLGEIGDISIGTAYNYACYDMFYYASISKMGDLSVDTVKYGGLSNAFQGAAIGEMGNLTLGTVGNSGCWKMFIEAEIGQAGNISADYVGDYACYSMYYDSEMQSVGDIDFGDIGQYGCSYIFQESTIEETGTITAGDVGYCGICSAFSDCASLKETGGVEVGTASFEAMEYMFSNCIELTKVPYVKAEKLGKWACEGMFCNCRALETAPVLPCTDLARGVYYEMFCGCISLRTAPELPATDIPETGYEYMFARCSALEYLPEIAAENVSQYCCRGMFANCSSLKLYESPQEGYSTEWSIGTVGTAGTGGAAAGGLDWNMNMLSNTGLDITEVEYGKTYYMKDGVTVTFQSNGGSAVDTQQIGLGWHAEEPEDPEYYGYIFDGWYEDSELTKPFDFENTYINENTTLYAKWIKRADIAAAAVVLAADTFTYTGKARLPEVTSVRLEGTVLDKASAYEYDSDAAAGTKVGQYTVTVYGIGDYIGTATATYRILPKKASVAKTEAATKKLKVTMGSKVSATGGSKYKVQYRVKGAKSWKTKYTSGRTLTIKSLKKGKKYQVRVRAYKKVNGKTYYGAWSKVKTSGKIR